jgi:hypothetical protein
MITSKTPEDFVYLIGQRPEDIVLFDNGTDDLLEQGRIILPRHYYLFNGTVDGELQYKPYEYDQYRVVVSVYKGTITNIESIG